MRVLGATMPALELGGWGAHHLICSGIYPLYSTIASRAVVWGCKSHVGPSLCSGIMLYHPLPKM